VEAELSRPARSSEEGSPVEPAPELESPAPKLTSSRSRCPYCHEEVRAERADWVACEGCLARHHTSCWHERGSCASCHARGALRRGRSLRARGLVAVALLAVAAVTGGFIAGRRAAPRPAEAELAKVAPKTARDEALLGLGFLSQTKDRERFMTRMIAAATRYDSEGKPDEAKLLRDVAAFALSRSVETAFDLVLKGEAASSEPKAAPEDMDLLRAKGLGSLRGARNAIHRWTTDETLHRDGSGGIRKIAEELVTASQQLAACGLADDAALAKRGAEAIYRNERLGDVWRLLAAPVVPPLERREVEIRGALVALAKPDAAPTEEAVAVWASQLRTLEAEYEKLGLGDSTIRARHADAAIALESGRYADAAKELIAAPQFEPVAPTER
jgi:hypothetical protein